MATRVSAARGENHSKGGRGGPVEGGWYEGALQAMAGGVDLSKLDGRGVEQVLSRARRFGLAAPVCQRLPAVGVVVRERLRLTAQMALVREATLEVARLFGGLKCLILKGYPLASVLFGEGSLERVSADVDVLVLPGDREEACARLRLAGYVPAADEAPREWAYNQHAWRHHTTGVLVELHWAVGFPELPHLGVGRCLLEAEVVELRGVEVGVPSATWGMVQLAVHLQQHLGFARGLLDLAAYVDAFGDEATFFKEVEALARGCGVWGVVSWGLRALEVLVGRKGAFEGLERGGAVEAWARLSAESARGCLTGEAPGRWGGTVAAVMPEVGSVPAILLRAATMLVLDRPAMRLRGALYATLLGPHEAGRVLSKAGLGRWLGPG
ncbi:nucleotidyltransferase family protein [Lujinxingia vulgaris]|uniref:Nucleotidyltransferase family protein n=1 Tax=Lujinxingia vulgaris TaxID=2600176 RepID=A0A5C6X1E1_9DELT|nr:nucleotidyltransferase family protein [Lujinxingia vulgaris]TXD34053.1 nucleotidyltransferase family protein [Lujinxingia vulgaris]